MGREVRRVPPNWKHPVQDDGSFQPMFNEHYECARDEWLAGLAAHDPGEHDGFDYWEWDGMPPERRYYIPFSRDEATWLQAYETVSEGTPVSPPFATAEELIEYLAEHGDFWDQRRRKRMAMGQHCAMNCEPWGNERARAFVEACT